MLVNHSEMKKNKPLLYDPQIINRVKKYLEDNVDKTYLDVSVMTRQLQERYPDYARRKIAPFRALVEQAYRIVSQSYGMESQSTSTDDSAGSDLEVMDGEPNLNTSNVMNSMVSTLYAKPKQITSDGANKSVGAGEAIDISSDESGDEAQSNGKTAESKASISLLSGLKNYRDVSVSKITATAESGASKSSSTNSNTTTIESTSSFSDVGSKRSDAPNTGPQPTKKQKLDPNGHGTSQGTVRFTAASQLIIQQQPQQNFIHPQQQAQSKNSQPQRQLNYHANGDHAHFPPNPVSAGQQQQQQNQQKPQPQRPRKYKKELLMRKPRETFQDIGGMEKTLKELCEVLMHVKSPDIYFVLGLMPPRGILLHGPPGCGKTLLARAIAGQLNLPMLEVPATELIAGVSGESEERIRDVFDQAADHSPCILFIDDIDAISSNRSHAQRDMERRMVSQLISSLDYLKQTEDGQTVVVIGATTRPDVLDPALRRISRFDHEVAIGIPTRKDRKDILNVLCDVICIDLKCDFDKLAELTPGYVGADLLALVSRAANIAVKRKCLEQMRAFQEKAQRNITIVDLDDDNEEYTDIANKTKKLADTVEQTKTNEDKAANEKEASIEKTTEGEQSVATATPVTNDATRDNIPDENSAKTTNPEIEAMEINSDPAVQPITETIKSTASSAENAVTSSPSKNKPIGTIASEQNDDKTEKEENNENKDCGVKDIASNVTQEPSLLELLNWIEHPPEEIAFSPDFCITFEDFLEALKVVQPTAKREGFITVPDVTWDDIGSLHDLREELQLAVLAPVKFPEKLERLGLSAPSGVLLCGPPGCGKTLVAKAIANEAGINFISVKGPELMNMYVGESERAVRACFQRARMSAPCVIFFDEFDSLCPKRSESNESGSGTRVVNQLLTEMDGVEERKGVYILAATNRPDIIDPAMLRPGRLDTILYVGLPDEKARFEILQATTKNGTRPVLAEDVKILELAAETDGYTGADLAGLMKQAAMLALRDAARDDIATEELCVRKCHLEKALQMMRPSVNALDRKMYERLRVKYAAPRSTSTADQDDGNVNST